MGVGEDDHVETREVDMQLCRVSLEYGDVVADVEENALAFKLDGGGVAQSCSSSGCWPKASFRMVTRFCAEEGSVSSRNMSKARMVRQRCVRADMRSTSGRS